VSKSEQKRICVQSECAVRDELRSQLDAKEKELQKHKEIVDEQANDEGLWFVAQTAPEAYLQSKLRELHAVIEMNNIANGEGE